ncbi:hypothetical protein [Bordetella petrii]|uniref:hypothetical protein n=1 Tax=Bordetella petrii TaxID=94624 RepID=UPI001E60E3FD|nr:hypothetical protein [Bordetella petrii]MCD0503403.1 hypothetical protein [Bordetella petrii]
MSTLFRFALQTPERRFSEIWSFFGSKREACIYATRTSMKGWLKVSFHQSGACHLKTYSEKSGASGEKNFGWNYPELTEKAPIHAMRIIYDIARQGAAFPPSNKVKFFINELERPGSIFMDMHFLISDQPILANESESLTAAYRLQNNRWVCFSIKSGSSEIGLPESFSGMSMHLGTPEKDASGSIIALNNATAVWYVAPKTGGTLSVFEGSWTKFPLNSGDS